MCGDGANDCGALKTAHAGIALVDSEASVIAPFTSKDPSIRCVPELIRQGRAALVTSFGVFKYMAGYSMCQFISLMFLKTMGTNLTDFQYLYIDLFLICSISAVFGYTDPDPGPLYKRPPLMSLISLAPIGSLLIQVFLIAFFQGSSIIAIYQQDWFETYRGTHNVSALITNDYPCHENYAIFCVSTFQYIFLAVAFSKGKPYRKPFFSNVFFVLVLLAATGFSLLATIDPPEVIRDWLQLEMPPFNFRMIVLGIIGLYVSYS
jgi:cation-transporting P-type ATPase 13A2